ncbi:adenylyltransferase/sulfurtransferase [Arthrobacter silviterrae]|uniref:Molybdopterin-synthase adenylyltransferase MoeB n=1 Tax=Arthrobacter silviterrae TaxID=2026658 RepID=A0ABX0DA33_9MICC|nr:molybdopterin-synthase adenylyltransferase MoeB [Arthrobacter silviterrae]MDQ0277203.1 adenylyltransferase/sulfurtransferase [Arthrobacter silviterrae]NGN83756.1 molybdopterin-synthase adenylyltransferase MoeB [Arthrobacter silviterrae]
MVSLIQQLTPTRAASLPPLVEPGPALSREEMERYSRHALIPEIGLEGQQRLRNARVLVIGAGGLGSPALLYLAAAGVGTLGVIDDDTVELSNLQRQVIHGVSDIGRTKLESARDAILELNPGVNVVLHPVRLDSSNALELFSSYDVILDGADNFSTRYLVNDAAALLGKPYVWGSILRFDGQVSVFWEKHGPNYRDLYPEPPAPGTVPSCAEGGVFGMLCASIGAMMVTEAVKLITGIGQTLLGRLLIFDALTARWREIRIAKDPAAAPITELIDYDFFCGLLPQGEEEDRNELISADRLAARLAKRERGEDSFVLVDVREPVEFAIARIPGSVLVPVGGIKDGTALKDIPRDVPLVLHCKSGGRSAQALASLKAAGYADVVHLDGGIDAWLAGDKSRASE